MIIEYLLTDYDGTLTIEGQLNSSVLHRIETLSKIMKVVIVTGRPLSWCNMMIHTFPITAIIGENGSGYYYKRDNTVNLVLLTNTEKLNDIKNDVTTEFPTVTLSDDNIHRLSDFAVVIDDEYNRLEKDILKYLDSKKYQYKKSNIHLNILSGTYDKMFATRHIFSNVFNSDLSKAVYFGDSPNDEPMFKTVKESYGVNNITPFLDIITHKPKYITDQPEGYGFLEATHKFCS